MNAGRLLLELRRALRPALLVVALVLLGLYAAATILRNTVAGEAITTGYHDVRVQFEDVKGVNPGQHRVRLAGVDIGYIKEAEVVDGRPVLTLAIKDEHGDLYRDARMRLRPLTPLQDMYVDITSRGHRRAGVLDGDHVLSARRTASAVDISRVLNTFEPDVRARLGRMLSGFGAGLEDNGAQLREAFAQLAPFLRQGARLSRVVALRRTRTKRLMHELPGLLEAIGQRDRELVTIVREGNATLASLARVDGPLDATLRTLPPFVATLESSLARVHAAEATLDPALDALRPVAGRLEAGLRGLERSARAGTPALASLRPPLRALRPLVRALRPAATALRGTTQRLRPQAPQLDRATALLPPCFDGLQNFFQHTLSIYKFADANGAYPRGEAVEDANLLGDTNKGLNTRKLPRCTDGRR